MPPTCANLITTIPEGLPGRFSHSRRSSHTPRQEPRTRRRKRKSPRKDIKDHLGHSKQREKPGCKNQTIWKLQDPSSHFRGPVFVNLKRPFPATKRAFEVNKARTDVSTSRYERIVKFHKAFVTSHKGLCARALWSSATIHFLRSRERPIPIVWKIQTFF